MKETKQMNKNTLIWVILGIIVLIVVVFFLIKACSKPSNEYTVEFDSNGGSLVESVTVKENSTVTKPSDPIKEGYKFAGWYYDSQLFDFNTKITKDITLIANWNSDGIELNNATMSLLVGSEEKISFGSLPEGVTETDLVYTTSDNKIVTVEGGVVKAIKAGTATITIKTKDGGFSATCTVTVTEKVIEVEEVTISGSDSVTVGSTLKLSAKVTPTDATNKNVKWTSSDTSIATVDSKGNVKALKAGTVTITVTSDNGKTATKTITVNAKKPASDKDKDDDKDDDKQPEQPKDVLPTKVVISGTKTVYVGESITLTAKVSPSNAKNKTVTWSINDTSKARISSKGKVTGVKPGKVTVTATTSNGKKATYVITVKEKEHVYRLVLTPIPVEGVDATYDYTYTVTMDNKAFTGYQGFILNGNTYRYVSSNPKVTSKHVKSKNTATITLTNGDVKTLVVVVNK